LLSDNQKLNAIVWGAKKHGISYGEFSAKLTEEKCKQIYTEYENSLIMKQKKQDGTTAKKHKVPNQTNGFD
jgi:hypothetical protein